MEEQQSKDPLHGITLQRILEQLVDYYGFDTLGELIKIKPKLRIRDFKRIVHLIVP